MKKILVVEDEQDSVEVVKELLKANNYDVICASDGEEGIKEAQQQRPDLILMDVLMPNMSGGDAIRILRADEKTKHIPVLFLTALTSPAPQGAEGKGFKIGEQFYPAISKLDEPEKLLSEIKRLMGDS